MFFCTSVAFSAIYFVVYLFFFLPRMFALLFFTSPTIHSYQNPIKTQQSAIIFFASLFIYTKPNKANEKQKTTKLFKNAISIYSAA